MYVVYGVIIVAMLFFLRFPITDATCADEICPWSADLGVLLAVSVVVPRLMH